MPWMTVAENLPDRQRAARAAAADPAARARPARAAEILAGTASSGSTRSSSSPALPLAQRQMLEIVRALLLEPRDPLPRRAHLGSRRARGRVALRPRARAARARHVRDLHVAPLGRGRRPGRPDHGLPQRRVRRPPGSRSTESEAVTLMTGRTIDRIYPELPPVPEDAPVALEVRDLRARGRERLLARAAPRRDPRYRRPGRPGPARALHDAVRRAQGDGRRDPRRREAQADPAPGRRDPGRARHRARARGPQDRGAAAADVRARQPHARHAAAHLRGRRHSSPATESRLVSAIVRAPPDPDPPAERAGGGHALGRQPAEGADRPLAARRGAT